MGMTWDKSLVREMGRITGMEAKAFGYTKWIHPFCMWHAISVGASWKKCMAKTLISAPGLVWK